MTVFNLQLQVQVASEPESLSCSAPGRVTVMPLPAAPRPLQWVAGPASAPPGPAPDRLTMVTGRAGGLGQRVPATTCTNYEPDSDLSS